MDTTTKHTTEGDAVQVGLDLVALDRDLGYILTCLERGHPGAAGTTVNDIRARIASAQRASQPGANENPVARLHLQLDDDGLAAEVEVLDGRYRQVENSPVDVYLAPPASKKDAPEPACMKEGNERALLNTLSDLMTWPSPQGTLVRLLDVKCRLIEHAQILPSQSG